MNWKNPPPGKKAKKKPAIGRKYRLPLFYCTECGYKLDAASCFGSNHKPTPGSLTICINCSHLYVFGDDLTPRELTDKEIVEWAGTPELLYATRAVAAGRMAKAVNDLLRPIAEKTKKKPVDDVGGYSFAKARDIYKGTKDSKNGS